MKTDIYIDVTNRVIFTAAAAAQRAVAYLSNRERQDLAA